LKAKGFLDFGPSKVIFGMPGKYSLLMGVFLLGDRIGIGGSGGKAKRPVDGSGEMLAEFLRRLHSI
jgi:hypothetical protein